ncbi:hypothetical protein [Gordoniibacillus kamchatkensis]|nr:hypothetical protein [Paenibacillus sp. VKM B-2647]
MPKRTPSAFVNAQLQAELTKHDATGLVLAGLYAEGAWRQRREPA